MPFYTGKGVPSDPDFKIEEFKGFSVSKCGKFWGSTQKMVDEAAIKDAKLKSMTRRERRAYEREQRRYER